ncbi:MAG: hypothetical protein JWN95_1478 [Frankiales bacterium]|nr:hypothetical protein [Frankiales bacterium]
MLIDCDTCAVRDIACGDCVVSVLLSGERHAVELDSAEQDALGALASGGLLPPLRLVPAWPAEAGAAARSGRSGLAPTASSAAVLPRRELPSDGGNGTNRSAIA